jgi:hypothetical protein
MGTTTTDRRIKKIKLAKCSICFQVPTPECTWRQGRCPHREPMISQAVIRNFFNFFKRSK